jgi:F1F0 ATPase subunit 2
MNSLFFIPITFLLGILLGNLYFRGLWMTVQKISTVPNPILLTFSSFLVRLAIAISGFYFVLMIAQEYAIFHLTICLLAFMGIRNYLIKKSLRIIPRIVNEY